MEYEIYVPYSCQQKVKKLLNDLDSFKNNSEKKTGESDMCELTVLEYTHSFN